MSDFREDNKVALSTLQDIFIEKEEDISLYDWMLRETTEDSDTSAEKFIMGNTIDGRDLVVGEYYMMSFPADTRSVVKLVRILKNSLGDDYVFENISGAESLASKSSSFNVNPNEFPLPVQILGSIRFNELKRK